MEISRSALIGRSTACTFDVIEAAEHYPEFLPWCESAIILARDASVVAARITVNYHGVRFGFTTRNPKERPRWMAIRLEQGPFRRFEGEWNLTELGPAACKIAFTLHYEFGGELLGRVASRVFDGIANTLVDAYARRAEQMPAEMQQQSDPDSRSTEGDAS
jgi:ribosome-associated toxin RatA of RatAB toxin-antitoxin module